MASYPLGTPRAIVMIGFFVAVVVLLGGLLPSKTTPVTGQGVAFHISEAGIDYLLHLLNSEACMPEHILAQPSIVQRFPAGEGSLGTFALTMAALEPGRWKIVSLGREPGLSGRCQQIEADIESFSGSLGTKYRVRSWGPQGPVRCSGSTQPTEVVCGNR